MSADSSLLQAALIGYQAELLRIDEAIAAIRSKLGQTAKPAGSSTGTRKAISAVARKRMAAAQKKRWAAYRKQKAARK